MNHYEIIFSIIEDFESLIKQYEDRSVQITKKIKNFLAQQSYFFQWVKNLYNSRYSFSVSSKARTV